MKKFIIAFFVSLACIFGFFGLHLGLSTMVKEPSYEPIATNICPEEEDRLNYTYTISYVIEGGREGHKFYFVQFEEQLTKVYATGLTFHANEEFGSTLKPGQKLTVKEIEENLIY